MIAPSSMKLHSIVRKLVCEVARWNYWRESYHPKDSD